MTQSSRAALSRPSSAEIPRSPTPHPQPDPDAVLDAVHTWVFRAAPVGMVVIGLDRCVIECNPALSTLMSLSTDEIVGRDVVDLVLPEHRQATEVWLARCFSGSPRAVHLETWFHRPTGDDAWVLVDGQPVLDGEGRTTSVILTFSDATDTRRLHDDLETAHRDLATLAEEAPVALEASEHRWRTLIQNIADTVTVVDADGHILASTGELKTILGYPREMWVGSNLADLLHPDDLQTLQPVIDRVLTEPGTEISAEARVRHQDGSWVDLQVNAVNLLHDPHVNGVVLTTRNVTERRRAETLVASQSEILELIATGAPLDDVLDAIAAMIEDHDDGSQAAVLIVEGDRLRPRARTHRGPSSDLRSALADVQLTPEMRASMERAHGVPVVIGDIRTDRPRTQLTEAIEAEQLSSLWWAPVQSRSAADPVGAVISFHDRPHQPSAHARRAADVACTLIAVALERHSTINELAHRALHDDLTGLPNRTLLLDRLQIGLDRARRLGEELAVLYVDIDRFKMVNDSYGHAAGDRILTEVADRIRAVTRPGDTIARVGADEFVIVCDRPGSLSTLLSVADRLTEALRDPFAVAANEVFLTASLGLALGVPGSDGATLLRSADAAMYRAKQRGRNRLEMYDSAMQATAHDRLSMGSDLRRALERDELRMVYQPIVSLARGEIVGAEALLRWHHPTRGEVPPMVFIPVAEETGVINEIGSWVLDTALSELAPLASRHEAFSLSVNLSVRQLDDPALVNRVTKALRAHDWPGESLCLELTETALTEDLDTALRVLLRLRSVGARIAVDDFGTGYSSLTHLQRLPVDTIKIDRSFVRGLGETGTSDRSAIATAVIGIAQAMGLTAVAEGVETPAQLNALRELGCAQGQGYLFSVPVPADALLELAALGS